MSLATRRWCSASACTSRTIRIERSALRSRSCGANALADLLRGARADARHSRSSLAARGHFERRADQRRAIAQAAQAEALLASLARGNALPVVEPLEPRSGAVAEVLDPDF